MLILSRKLNESVVINGQITVKIIGCDGDRVRLGIQAPIDVPVHRHEVYEEIQRANLEAVNQVRRSVPRLNATLSRIPPVLENPAADVPMTRNP
jgi:carbon storage regulator